MLSIFGRHKKTQINFQKIRQNVQLLQGSETLLAILSPALEIDLRGEAEQLRKLCEITLHKFDLLDFTVANLNVCKKNLTHQMEIRMKFYSHQAWDRLTEQEYRECEQLNEAVEFVRSTPMPNCEFKNFLITARDFCNLNRPSEAVKEIKRLVDYLDFIRQLYDYMLQVVLPLLEENCANRIPSV
jgi:hypothetical protein